MDALPIIEFYQPTINYKKIEFNIPNSGSSKLQLGVVTTVRGDAIW